MGTLHSRCIGLYDYLPCFPVRSYNDKALSSPGFSGLSLKAFCSHRIGIRDRYDLPGPADAEMYQVLCFGIPDPVIVQ